MIKSFNLITLHISNLFVIEFQIQILYERFYEPVSAYLKFHILVRLQYNLMIAKYLILIIYHVLEPGLLT